MYFYQDDITFQEVPNEVSLVFSISGCPLRCKGCHSKHLWKERGLELSTWTFLSRIEKYESLITCICFFGGEWEEDKLVELLKLSREKGFKTCLYTGLDDVSDVIKDNLDFLKTGPWIEKLGGLDSITTNQRFIDVKSGNIMNHLFRKDTHEHGGTNA
jgi:anaerobic ribonucleoside-triphosphate reductase activating protein